MARRTSLRALTSAVLLALLVTAVLPQPAFADDGTPLPPAPDSPGASDPALADPAGQDPGTTAPPDPAGDLPATAAEAPAPEALVEPAAEPAADSPDGAPALPVDAPSNTASEPAEAGEAAASADNDSAVEAADLLAALPEYTTLAVIDAQGEAVPLVSGEAEAVIATADPVWCPASLSAPTPGSGGCSPSFGNLQLLLDYLSNDATEPSQDGIIWIQEGSDSSAAPLVLDGNLLGDAGFLTLSQYQLTLRGGWDGVSGSKMIDPLSPSIFYTRLEITHWKDNVTLSDVNFFSSSGNEGVEVIMEAGSAGNITLTRVASIGHAAGGARLDTSLGTGKVSVSDSYFETNTGTGLRIDTAGAVTLNHLVVHNNTQNGARVDATYGTGSVTLGAGSTFTQNGIAGLMVESNGAITASDLIASYNGNIGAALLNDRGTAASGSPGIKLTGSSEFTGNGLGGLSLGSFGTITASNLHANSNAVYDGVTISNNSSVGPRPVTLTGTSTMKYNGQDGILINSNGKVTLSNLTANGNHRAGLTVSAPEVALTGLNTFNENTYDGLYAETDGAFTAANLTADRNGGNGLFLTNWTVKPTTFSGANSFRDNYDDGLHLEVWGTVTLSNVTAGGSTHGDGAEILNTASGTSQKVTLSGTNVFNDNYYSGLLVTSLGAISVSNLRASGNGSSGAGVGASLSNHGAPATPQSITLTGSSLTNGNRSTGLFAQSKGNITLANVTSAGNSGNGGYLKNDFGTGNITLTGTNIFDSNYGRGLELWSAGVVKISNLHASANSHNQGALIVNATAGPTSPPKDVTLSGVLAFDGNYAGGLEVRSYGAITLGSATAIGNGTGGSGTGISLDNDDGSVTKPLTLSGTYVMSNNHGYGLIAGSMGQIKINNLTASSNTGCGAYISGTDSFIGASITLTGSNTLSSNGAAGLEIHGTGPILVNAVTASGNGTAGSGRGAWLDNLAAVDAQMVKLTGTNVFNNNHDTGLDVEATGAISVSSLTASGNLSGTGARLINNSASPTASSPGVTLTGASTFDENGGDGLRITTYGAVSLNSISGRDNGDAGLSVNNAGAAAPKAVKLTGTNAFLGNGMVIQSLGAISANNLSVVNAPGDVCAACLDNDSGTAGVTLTGVNVFSGNAGNGLLIFTHGAVSLTRITADDNAQNGINISGPASSITLTCGVATANGLYGMQATTSGLLKLIGWFSLGVNGDDLTYGDMQVTRACPSG